MAFGIPNIERAVSNFLEGGTGITAVRSIEWDKKYLWIVDFVDMKPPKPFNEMFPVSEISLPFAELETETVDLGITSMDFPLRTTPKEITVTFFDDETRTLLKWFSDWINLDILNYGQFVSGMKDDHLAVEDDSFGERRKVVPMRSIRLAMLDASREEVSAYTFWVFPKGRIEFNGAQASEAQSYTLTFSIVQSDLGGKITENSFFSMRTAKEFLGRFI